MNKLFKKYTFDKENDYLNRLALSIFILYALCDTKSGDFFQKYGDF